MYLCSLTVPPPPVSSSRRYKVTCFAFPRVRLCNASPFHFVLASITMPRTSLRRALDLAYRIESSGTVSQSACLACRRVSHQCIRSIESIRCARCVRLNRRCLSCTPPGGYNSYVSVVRANIRRLRTSLTTLERFVTFSTAVPRDSDRNAGAPSVAGDTDSNDSVDDISVSEGSDSDDMADRDSFVDGDVVPGYSSAIDVEDDAVGRNSPVASEDAVIAEDIIAASATGSMPSSMALSIPHLLNPHPSREFLNNTRFP
jgi:hypothetical protein